MVKTLITPQLSKMNMKETLPIDKIYFNLFSNSTTTRCLCGDVVAFNVPLAIEHTQLKIPSRTIGWYVRTFELGCTREKQI